MEKILTVVVPTYNAEKYLRDNLESFEIPELMQDLEILIVNDGSTDHSLEIAREYAERYPDTYRVITKENGGHGSGINCGIEYALGTYFKVVDADDWVGREAFVSLVRTLKTSDADGCKLCNLQFPGLWRTQCNPVGKEIRGVRLQEVDHDD